ncbi:MAG: methyltransferase [Myxococcota bacterium]
MPLRFDLRLDQYHTPPWLAEQIVARWWRVFARRRVLEPSAGGGVLVDALFDRLPDARVTAIEMDRRWVRRLRRDQRERIERGAVRVIAGDYLRLPPLPPHDIVFANPPFTDGLDTAHLRRMVDEVGEFVAVLRLAAWAGRERRECVWSRGRMLHHAILEGRPRFSGMQGTPRHEFAVTHFARSDLVRGRRAAEPEWWDVP